MFINLLVTLRLDQQILLSQEKMLGLCQNVEIIHEHHHHFYEVVVSSKNRNRSLLSKTINPESSLTLPSPSSTSFRLDSKQEPSTSLIYRPKRAYLNGNHRGIEVLSRKQDRSFQLSRINLQNAAKNQHHNQSHFLTERPINFQKNSCILPPEPIRCEVTPEGSFVQLSKNWQINKVNEKNTNETLDQSFLKSSPTVSRNQIPHQNIRANHYFNTHQLKHSTIGFKNNSVYETKKKNRQILHKAQDYNISLSIPATLNSKPKNYYHQSSEIYLRDNDSMMTRKENGILSAFKTEQMFDDAKSIVSFESLHHSRLNIEESIIVNRTMDCFTNVTSKKELSHCSLYLAVQNSIGWLVSLREFEFKREEVSMREARLYALLSHEEGELPVLLLYRMMMEGSGLSKTIFFILEPFETLLPDLLIARKTYFRSVPSAFNHFLQDFSQQAFQALTMLASHKLAIIEPLDISDFAISSGRYKLHSLLKFQLEEIGQFQTRQSIQACVEKLKSSIIESVIFS